ncbi:transcriptional regulator of aroF, aroG, tyrA and aromatic amino acid transport [Plasticicumulans lactativorans]|uniref:Transcriptional regulator of aroF, aroG, tyrA and aromatic amino acid transport n=1 Tax=Plasticicumulans lactativorans TaxID=1133106 RepID=A0A4R2KXD5_9GAMM|nr:sigma 54-interacting transcriptional regulator [Plasticicumulans lactativorans]TCO79251.1 transcriptional regulator of aroF, aroG, tyrA and aromatic amino acid transport [Plasticicumulans lactativorans]
MRLQVNFEDRVGIGTAVLTVLARHNINLDGLEMLTQTDRRGALFMYAAAMKLDDLQRVTVEIRAVPGVLDVRPIPLLPSERKQSELRTLLSALPAPVLSVDLQGRVIVANEAAQQLLKLKGADGQGTALAPLVDNLDLVELIDKLDRSRYGVQLAVRGQALLADVFPVLVPVGKIGKSLSGAVLVLHGGAATPVECGADLAGFQSITHESASMRALIRQARRMAPLPAPLLIHGATGTGKAALAHACHLAGPRREAPFLRLNAADLAEDSAEQILFGAGEQPGLLEQGAGGTLFLNEVAGLSTGLQLKLLGFLQTGRFRRVGALQSWRSDVRVIAATREDLAERCREGRFRDDLYYHLNVLSLQVPQLHERQADILPIAQAAIEAASRQLGIAPPRLTAEAEQALLAHPWPGNVRQLENTVLRAVTVAEAGAITAEHLALGPAESADEVSDALFAGTLADAVARLERLMLTRLYPSHPSTRQLARRLGLSHTAIANKLRQYGIAGGAAASRN